METVQNAAASAQGAAAAAYNTASKLIFGEGQTAESGKEPVSGEQGEGTTSSAFDQGNAADGAAAGESSSKPALGDSVVQKEESGQEPLSGAQGKGAAGEPFDLGNKNDGAAAGQSTSNTQTSTLSSSAGAVSQGGQQDAVKASNDAPEEAMAKEDTVVDNTAEGGNDLSGEAIKAKATGEGYSKSTGLAADGGNFDASKPGAGAEASRLMEEKGTEKEDRAHPNVDPDAGGVTGVDDKKVKPKLSERIKDKLHIHKH